VGRLVVQIGTAAQSELSTLLGHGLPGASPRFQLDCKDALRVTPTSSTLKLRSAPPYLTLTPPSPPHRIPRSALPAHSAVCRTSFSSHEKGPPLEPPDRGQKAPPSANPEAPDSQDRAETPVLRVLVVDDDAGVRDVAVRLLEFEGVQATSVASGQEALQLLDSESFDCVLLDLTMPRFSGPDTFRALRKRNRELPVVFSSGQRDMTVDALVSEGKNAYFLDKPFTPRRLLDAIARACKR